MSEGQRDREPELLEQFKAITSSAELEDLRILAARLLADPARPSRRRPPRLAPVTLRVRVDLEEAEPAIWRLIDLRSDLTLDVVHEVLQTAYGWSDSHLHRFALGDGAFDADAEAFLCPWELEEGESHDGAEGRAAAGVRLDEVLSDPGDVLRYCYDYGDSWDLVLTLQEVLPLDDTSLGGAVCVDGRCAAPPEDCGGLRTRAELAGVLPDPDHFDVDEVNRSLNGPFGDLPTSGLRPELLDVLERLRTTAVGEELAVRAWGLSLRRELASREERGAALHPYRWFLDRVGDEGLPLTAAGYLKPGDVSAAAEVVPDGPEWIGAKNREIDTHPVLVFRERLQALGLVRKQKGRLLLTRAGRAARDNVDVLWAHLADRLPLGADRDGSKVAGLLALLLLASSPDRTFSASTVADALTGLGWREADGQPISAEVAKQASFATVWALDSLRLGPRPRSPMHESLTPVAADLAALALRSST